MRRRCSRLLGLVWLSWLMTLGCDSGAGPAGDAGEPAKGIQAIVGAMVYPVPDEGPIPDGVVVVRDDTIIEVGPRADVAIPPDAAIVEATGMHLFAGFQTPRRAGRSCSAPTPAI